MSEYYKRLIREFNENIKKLNHQRKLWLIFSSIIFGIVILLIFFAESINRLHSHTVWWVIGSFGLLISVNWWYWTLTLIRRVLQYQENVVIILSEITEDVRDIKSDITEMHKNGLLK